MTPSRPRTLADLVRWCVGLLLVLLALNWFAQWANTPRFQGQPLEVWRERLLSPDLAQRRLALEALAFLPASEPTTLANLTTLVVTEEDDLTRATGVKALAVLLAAASADGSNPADDLLRTTLDRLMQTAREDGDRARRSRAALALAAVASVHQPEAEGTDPRLREYQGRAVALLLERVGDENESQRLPLLRVLEKMPALPPEAEPALLAAWRREAGDARERAVACLTAIPHLTPAALPALLDQMATSDLTLRVMPHLHRQGPAAVPALVALLRWDDPRASLAQELLAQRGQASLPALRQAWQRDVSRDQMLVAQTLARMGDSGRAVLLPDLLSADGARAELVRSTFLGSGPGIRAFLERERPRAEPSLQQAMDALLEVLPDARGGKAT